MAKHLFIGSEPTKKTGNHFFEAYEARENVSELEKV